MKKEITYEEYLQLEGLMLLANRAYKEGERCNDAMNEVIGNNDFEKDYDRWTLLSDEYLQDSTDVKECLKNMGIKVVKKVKKKK